MGDACIKKWDFPLYFLRKFGQESFVLIVHRLRKRENIEDNMAENCREVIMSEDYIDILIPIDGIPRANGICGQKIGGMYEVQHWFFGEEMFRSNDVGYYSIPKLYGLLDTTNMEASGVPEIQNQPVLALRGSGVLIGFVDTGIDYQNEVFLNPDGSSRIAAIWDQTIQEGEVPEGFLYGTEYTKEQIDQALGSENPLEIVPSVDNNGHGTFLAGIAAGNKKEDETFYGVAPESMIAMVKLKPAKRYLRDFFFIKEGADAYQENDIMAGLDYLRKLAERLDMPLVIGIGLGTNQGSHLGVAPIENLISQISSVIGNIVVTAAGNETGRGHHYDGTYRPEEEYNEVEIRVGENERGFSLEFWARAPEYYSIAIRSPSGEYTSRIVGGVTSTQVVDFVFENTRIYVDYRTVVQVSGAFLILMRFQAPTPGVWTIRIYNSLYIDGNYDMWLPMEQFISPDTVFLRPSPNSTLTIPATTANVIVTSAYNHVSGGIYVHSSRGYPLSNIIKPDLAAPGVDVYGPMPGNRFGRMTGTSVAAAHMVGAAALLLEWALVRGNREIITTGDAIAFFIRGATRRSGFVYPNREWGYGTLNVYQVFERIRDLAT